MAKRPHFGCHETLLYLEESALREINMAISETLRTPYTVFDPGMGLQFFLLAPQAPNAQLLDAIQPN